MRTDTSRPRTPTGTARAGPTYLDEYARRGVVQHAVGIDVGGDAQLNHTLELGESTACREEGAPGRPAGRWTGE